jgi:hypothetical protein
VQQRLQLTQRHVGGYVSVWPRRHRSFAHTPHGQAHPRLRGDSPGGPVQPAGDGPGRADRSRLASEQQERGLESVFGVVIVAEHLPTDAPNERAVAADQLGERVAVAVGGEAGEQIGVGVGRVPARADEVQERCERSAGHPTAPGGRERHHNKSAEWAT